MITFGGHLRDAEKKVKASAFKTGCGRLRNLSGGRLRESSWNIISLKQNGYLQSGRLREVVVCEKWSLRESGFHSTPSSVR